ncbi:hypothetical protein AB0J90_10170 [Micromonospora sp. NPDC049523]|uniref:hypothetical protein n=1 Tax=Micromonospora sp. NPDC049523 TaxID=3155921 RepID=UPI00342092D8
MKVKISKGAAFELGLHESEENAHTAAALHFVMIMLSALATFALIWGFSQSVALGLVAGAIVMSVGIIFVRSARAQKRSN